MTKTLQDAFAAASKLPDEAQDRIGRELLHHLGGIQALRAEIEKGITSLDEGRGRSLDLDAVLGRARDPNAV